MAFDPAASPSLPPDPLDRPACHHHHHHLHHHHRLHGLFPGLVLVAWGGLLLLRELGLVDPALRVIDFWPLVIVGLGLSIAVTRRGLGSLLFGLAVALLGAGLLAERLGYAPGVARLWPVLIIAAGLGVLWNGATRRRPAPRFSDEKVSADALQRAVTMGNLALVVDSQQFQGGALSVTMGEIRADLRRAAMAGDEATLDLAVTMGNVELLVPASWQVVSDIPPFMGSVEDQTAPRPDAMGVQKRLVLRGKITMGVVTIKG